MAYQDIPDIKTQIALNKVRGLTPNLTPAEQKAFADQQYLESEQLRIAKEKGLPSLLGGDVRSYTGSMFAPVGSPMAAVPMPQGAPRVGEMGGGIDVNAYRGSMFGEGVMGAAPILGGSRTQPYNPNVSADAILGRAFGKRPAGQISYAPSGQVAPQTFTQGQQTPRGSIVGAGESISMGQKPRMAPSAPILGQNYQGVPDMTGGYEAAAPSPVSRPSMAAPAPVQQTQLVQPSMLGGTPVSMPQQAPAMAPLLGAYQPGSQEYSYLQQRGAAPQTLGYAAQAAEASPYMQQLGMQKQQFAATQQERQTKELINRAASQYAIGNTDVLNQLPPQYQAEVKFLGTKMAQDIAVKPEKVSDFKVAFEIEKNAILESKPPGSTLTAAELSRASQAARGQPSQEQIIAGEVSKMKLRPTEKMVDTDLLKGAAAREVAPALNNLSKLFETTDFKTGSTEPVKTQIRSVLSGLGLPVDEAKLANAQEAMTYFNQLIIPYFQATKGSITDKENALFASMGPQFAKDTTTNKRLLSILSERNKVLLSLEDLANRFGSEDMNPQQYNKQRRDILASYDKKIDTGFGDILKNKPSQSANQEIRTDKMGNRWILGPNGKPVKAP
jgi:hypothetical protein